MNIRSLNSAQPKNTIPAKKQEENTQFSIDPKKLNRTDRISLAKKWTMELTTKKVIKSYMKHFGVDKLCAAKELTMAGIELQEKYAHKWATRRERKAKAKRNKVPNRSNIFNAGNPTVDSDDFHYFVAG